MAPILKKFRATVGATGSEREYFFLANPSSYAGSLDTITGIKEATETEQKRPAVKIGELLNSGECFRINIRYSSGTGFKTGKIIVAKGKIDTALDQLVGKPYRGGTITSAAIPTKATFF